MSLYLRQNYLWKGGWPQTTRLLSRKRKLHSLRKDNLEGEAAKGARENEADILRNLRRIPRDLSTICKNKDRTDRN